MITEATQEQWDQIEELRKQVIDRQTEQVELPEVTKAVHQVFAEFDAKPAVVLMDSPAAASSAWYFLRVAVSRLQSRPDEVEKYIKEEVLAEKSQVEIDELNATPMTRQLVEFCDRIKSQFKLPEEFSKAENDSE